MALSREQQKVLSTILRVGRRMGAPRKHIKAAIETGLVEANLTNPRGGEGTSAGWRQEINTYGSVGKRTNIAGAAQRFFQEAAQKDRGQSSGALAQDVQRSAFPGKYAQRAGEAGRLLRGGGGGGEATTSTPGRTLRSPGYPNPARQDVLLDYFRHRGQPGALVGLSEGLKATQATPGTTVHIPGQQVPAGGGGGDVAKIASRAQRVSQAAPPYSWGGGHGATPAKLGTPVDCSGAVSQVLGVNPRVSGQFAKWGKPGRGKVTVYANAHHVLMEINGRFWGTSASNKGGGAGWISRSQISPEYLRGFTARHL